MKQHRTEALRAETSNIGIGRMILNQGSLFCRGGKVSWPKLCAFIKEKRGGIRNGERGFAGHQTIY
jgi:hypothetical protein